MEEFIPEKITEIYSQSLSREDLEEIQRRTVEIKMLVKRTGEDIIQIGENLKIIKSKLQHGDFRKWIEEQFSWSVSTATKFMQVYERFKSVNFTHLNFSPSAMYLLAAPSTSPEAFQEAIEISNQGQLISFTVAKKLKYQHQQGRQQKSRKKVESLAQQPQEDSQEKYLDFLAIRTEVNEKIDNQISSLAALGEHNSKIIEIVAIKNLLVLINQQIKISQRNNHDFSLIFVFFKTPCLNFYQYLIINEEFTSKIRLLFSLLFANSLWRNSDFIVNREEQDFDLIFLPSTNLEGATNVTKRIISKLELDNSLEINWLDFLSFGIYNLQTSSLVLDSTNLSNLLNKFKAEIHSNNPFFVI